MSSISQSIANIISIISDEGVGLGSAITEDKTLTQLQAYEMLARGGLGLAVFTKLFSERFLAGLGFLPSVDLLVQDVFILQKEPSQEAAEAVIGDVVTLAGQILTFPIEEARFSELADIVADTFGAPLVVFCAALQGYLYFRQKNIAGYVDKLNDVLKKSNILSFIKSRYPEKELSDFASSANAEYSSALFVLKWISNGKSSLSYLTQIVESSSLVSGLTFWGMDAGLLRDYSVFKQINHVLFGAVAKDPQSIQEVGDYVSNTLANISSIFGEQGGYFKIEPASQINLNSAKNNFAEFLALAESSTFALVPANSSTESILELYHPDLFKKWQADQLVRQSGSYDESSLNFTDNYYSDHLQLIKKYAERNVTGTVDDPGLGVTYVDVDNNVRFESGISTSGSYSKSTMWFGGASSANVQFSNLNDSIYGGGVMIL